MSDGSCCRTQGGRGSEKRDLSTQREAGVNLRLFSLAAGAWKAWLGKSAEGMAE